jgi:dTDP-glucose 4,6-dehydratase
MRCKSSNILITGGLGFMGSAFIRHLLQKQDFKGTILNVDAMTYAADLRNVQAVQTSSRYFFLQADINQYELLEKIILEREITIIVNFAAQTHVDRSIAQPGIFMESNIRGTYTLLEIVRKHAYIHFHQISTDEVFGSLQEQGKFTETSGYRPNSPYAASKAAADHLVRSYVHTYNISATISHSVNNYGAHQCIEKFIPLLITRALQKKSLPIYGNGENIREWIFVEDHAEAVWRIIMNGGSAESYNIGGTESICNIDLVQRVLRLLAQEENVPISHYECLIQFVQDRPGHDFRYGVDASKIFCKLRFLPTVSLEKGLRKTIQWYRKQQKKRAGFSAI